MFEPDVKGIDYVFPRSIRALATSIVVFAISSVLAHAEGNSTRVVYTTSFEATEGYQVGSLEGQDFWRGIGPGAGFVEMKPNGAGQHARIGLSAPEEASVFFSLKRRVTLDSDNVEEIRISAEQMIGLPQPLSIDLFAWVFWNSDNEFLFAIDFNDLDGMVYYELPESESFVVTGVSFVAGKYQLLEIAMNLSDNRWSATLDGNTLVANERIAADGIKPDLGWIDVWWYYFDSDNPGESVMWFDDIEILSLGSTISDPSAPKLLISIRSDTSPILRLQGEPGCQYQVQSSQDLKKWVNFRDVTLDSDSVESSIPIENSLSQSFFRAIVVP